MRQQTNKGTDQLLIGLPLTGRDRQLVQYIDYGGEEGTGAWRGDGVEAEGVTEGYGDGGAPDGPAGWTC